MTTGSTTTFEQTRDELIADALTNVGALGPDGTPSGKQLNHAARALNRVAKSLDPEGIFLWRVARSTFATVDGTASYSTATTVLAIDEPMSFMAAGGTSRSTIEAMSRDEYMSIPDRTTEGTPSRFYAEPTAVTGGITVYFWPVPDTSACTIEYASILKSKDFSTGANTPDFPSQWTVALVYGLTAELAPAYGQPELAMQYRNLFLEEKTRQLNATTEVGGVQLVPFGGWY